MLNISNTIGVCVFSQNVSIYIYILVPKSVSERAIEKQPINKQTIFFLRKPKSSVLVYKFMQIFT